MLMCSMGVAAEGAAAAGLHWLHAALAVQQPENPYGPRRSDVIFSSRFEREEAPAAARAFGATRVEWSYANRRSYIERFLKQGMQFGGTLNANVKTAGDVGVAVDFDGQAIVAPWMASWGAKWVTSSHPETRAAHLQAAKNYIDAGAHSVQFDDPILQAGTVIWGGDFSAASLSGFAEFLTRGKDVQAALPPASRSLMEHDYREYLRREHQIGSNRHYLAKLETLPTTRAWKAYLEHSVLQFFAELRQLLSEYGGRRTALSMNLSNVFSLDRFHRLLAAHADYLIGETRVDSPGNVRLRIAVARALRLGYAPSFIPTTVAETRRALLVSYAFGATPLVPWDVYMGSDAAGSRARYFASVQDYGDIFFFVRKHPELMDGWDHPPLVAVLVDSYSAQSGELSAIARALDEFNVPFSVLLADQEITPEQARGAKALKALIVPKQAAPDEKTGRRLAQLGIPVIRGVPDRKWLRSTAVLFSWSEGDRPVFALKVRPEQSTPLELAIHVVRGNDLRLDGGSLVIHLDGLASMTVADVRWYSSTHDGLAVRFAQDGHVLSIDIPAGAPFGIAHVK
jgi:hypothetical protein